MVPIEISSPHSYSTSIHTIGLSCTVWLQYTTRQTTDDKQTERSERAAYAIPLASLGVLSDICERCDDCPLTSAIRDAQQ